MRYPHAGNLKEKVTLIGHNAAVINVLFSPDRKYLVTTDQDAQVKLWDFKSKKEIYSFQGVNNQKNNLIAFNPAGKQLASVIGNKIIVIDLENPAVKIAELNHPQEIYCLEYSPDGKSMASAGVDTEIKLWDTGNWQEICTFIGHSGPVLSLSFNHVGTYLLSGSADKTVKLWDVMFLTNADKAINEKNSAEHSISTRKDYQPEPVVINPIGILSTSIKERYEAPRQGVHASGTTGVIQLNPYCNFEQAVRDLEGFERIWVIYRFHLNQGWKPLVSPPRFLERKIGVFATRSPFRPNPIGMSCVKLVKVEGLKIYISDSDILDQSPVLDIKPYLPYSDSFNGLRTGWLEGRTELSYTVNLTEKAKVQSDWLIINYDFNIENYCKVQLQFEPENISRKRIHPTETMFRNSPVFVLHFRTWQIDYIIDTKQNSISVLKISSRYSQAELAEGTADKKKDKAAHRKFLIEFPNQP